MCDDGRCAAVDLRQESLTACTSDQECVVIERDCCACDPHQISVRRGSEIAYYQRTCGETPICSPCERRDIPDTLIGRCVEGHCAVSTEPPPVCPEGCQAVEQQRCQPGGELCSCAVLEEPFSDCRPSPTRPCPSARAFYAACDARCCRDSP